MVILLNIVNIDLPTSWKLDGNLVSVDLLPPGSWMVTLLKIVNVDLPTSWNLDGNLVKYCEC